MKKFFLSVGRLEIPLYITLLIFLFESWTNPLVRRTRLTYPAKGLYKRNPIRFFDTSSFRQYTYKKIKILVV